VHFLSENEISLYFHHISLNSFNVSTDLLIPTLKHIEGHTIGCYSNSHFVKPSPTIPPWQIATFGKVRNTTTIQG
jgi:hypothetical protein